MKSRPKTLQGCDRCYRELLEHSFHKAFVHGGILRCERKRSVHVGSLRQVIHKRSRSRDLTPRIRCSGAIGFLGPGAPARTL
jgi:hypothetical protein